MTIAADERIDELSTEDELLNGDVEPVTADELPSQIFQPGDRVKFRDGLGEITGVHADGSFDLHQINADGSYKTRGDRVDGAPLWFERVGPSEIEAL